MSESMLDDKWQNSFQQKKAEVEACQKEKQLPSCLKCGQLLVCELRETYVKSVYESMNKGQGGGFEF